MNALRLVFVLTLALGSDALAIPQSFGFSDTSGSSASGSPFEAVAIAALKSGQIPLEDSWAESKGGGDRVYQEALHAFGLPAVQARMALLDGEPAAFVLEFFRPEPGEDGKIAAADSAKQKALEADLLKNMNLFFGTTTKLSVTDDEVKTASFAMDGVEAIVRSVPGKSTQVRMAAERPAVSPAGH